MSKVSDELARVRKAIAAAVLAGGPLLVFFTQDSTPGVTKEQWLGIAASGVLAAVGVWAVPNEPQEVLAVKLEQPEP